MSAPVYRAPRWLPGGHAQTIWPVTLRPRMPDYRRERWDTPDGDFIDLDFIANRPGAPAVLLFHGLEGSSRSGYACALMAALEALGWNGAVAHFRGCSGEPNRLPRAYHSGDADEIHWILTRFARCFEGVERHAVGVSLGGNALLVWLGRAGADAAGLLTRAAAVSAPLDLTAAGRHLERGFNRVYTEHFLRTMRRNAAHKGGSFPGQFDVRSALRARTLFEFDNAYTAPVHGFHDASDYWTRASSKPVLPLITLPTLVLNARNDPFLPPHALPRPGEAGPAVLLDQPAEGGHVGFVQGSFPGRLDWLPERLIHFFRHGT